MCQWHLTAQPKRCSISDMGEAPENHRLREIMHMASSVLGTMTAQGYPITDQRRTLVTLIMSRTRSFTADDLLRDLKNAEATIGRATVFRTLDLLVRLGYLTRIPDGERKAYAVCDRGGDHHHHLICSTCGQVLHLEECPIAAMLSELESRTGYQIEHHRLEVAGICPACRR